MAEPNGQLAGSIAGYEPGTGRVEVLFPVGEFEDVRDWGDPGLRAAGDRTICAARNRSRDAPGRRAAVARHQSWRPRVRRIPARRTKRGRSGAALAWLRHRARTRVFQRRGGATRGWILGDRHDAEEPSAVVVGDGWVVRRQHRQGLPVDARTTASPSNAGSAMPFPNGIEKGPDEDVLYVASFFGNDVRRLDLKRGEVIGDGEGRTSRQHHVESRRQAAGCVAYRLVLRAVEDVARFRKARAARRSRSSRSTRRRWRSSSCSRTAARRSAACRLRCASPTRYSSVRAPATGSRAGTSSARRRRTVAAMLAITSAPPAWPVELRISCGAAAVAAGSRAHPWALDRVRRAEPPSLDRQSKSAARASSSQRTAARRCAATAPVARASAAATSATGNEP